MLKYALAEGIRIFSNFTPLVIDSAALYVAVLMTLAASMSSLEHLIRASSGALNEIRTSSSTADRPTQIS